MNTTCSKIVFRYLFFWFCGKERAYCENYWSCVWILHRFSLTAWRKFEKFYLEMVLQYKNQKKIRTFSFPLESNVAPKMYFKQAEWETPALVTEKRYSTEKKTWALALTAVSTKTKWILSTVLLPMCSVFPWALIGINVLILSSSLSVKLWSDAEVFKSFMHCRVSANLILQV